MSSQSDFTVNFEFVGTSLNIKGHVRRIVSPLTIQALLDKAPFTARGRHNLGMPKSYYMLLVDLKRGKEREALKEVHKGDIVYCPRQDALFLIYSEPVAKINFPVFPIGKLEGDFDSLAQIRNGTMVKISFKDVSK